MTTDIPDWIAFARAAEWLGVPVDVLALKDEPVPHIGRDEKKRVRGELDRAQRESR